MEIVFVVAVADNGVIGAAGRLPWRLKSDLRHFRTLTMGHPVVMGRRTYLSIGKPLPGRTNIVVSRESHMTIPGALVVPTLHAALEVARGDALRRSVDAVMVIGGADIYAQLMPMATRIELTRVHSNPSGDACFGDLDPTVWRETARSDHAAASGDDAAFTFLTYRRIDGTAPGRRAALR